MYCTEPLRDRPTSLYVDWRDYIRRKVNETFDWKIFILQFGNRNPSWNYETHHVGEIEEFHQAEWNASEYIPTAFFRKNT